MPVQSHTNSDATINLRLDAGLKASLMALAQAEKRTASDVIRELIGQRISELKERQLRAEIRGELDLIAQSEDEGEVMRWIQDVADLGDA